MCVQNNLEVLRGCLMKYPNDREYDPYEEETNKEKYNLIRQVFFSCSSLLNTA